MIKTGAVRAWPRCAKMKTRNLKFYLFIFISFIKKNCFFQIKQTVG